MRPAADFASRPPTTNAEPVDDRPAHTHRGGAHAARVTPRLDVSSGSRHPFGGWRPV